jgi:hypothetical protein
MNWDGVGVLTKGSFEYSVTSFERLGDDMMLVGPC